jgi:ribosomal protein S18 acetylase RimI-like enzyme
MTAPLKQVPLEAWLKFRPMTLADAGDLHQNCWPERNPEAVAGFLERCMVQMDGKRARAVVAEFDEQVTAFALLTFWREVGEIGDLIVAEKQRSIGIGSAMIAHLIGAARGRGITRIEIGAAASNPRALALYKRLGFIAHRKIELDLGAGNEPVVYLHMNLT